MELATSLWLYDSKDQAPDKFYPLPLPPKFALSPRASHGDTLWSLLQLPLPPLVGKQLVFSGPWETLSKCKDNRVECAVSWDGMPISIP